MLELRLLWEHWEKCLAAPEYAMGVVRTRSPVTKSNGSFQWQKQPQLQ